MLSFEEFFPVEFPEKTKVKFNMNAGNVDYPAWDYLRDDAEELGADICFITEEQFESSETTFMNNLRRDYRRNP